MKYTERPPTKRLAPWVKRIWQLKGSFDSQHVRFLPDAESGYLFDLGEPTLCKIPLATNERDLMSGPFRTGFAVEFSGDVDLFGVLFHPGATRPFFGLPILELESLAVGIDDRNGPLLLSGPLSEVQDFRGRYQIVTNALERVADDVAIPDPTIARTVQAIRNRRGCIGVRELCELAGLEERRLERRFRSEVGHSPRTMIQIIRFDAAKELMLQRPEFPLSRIALAAGYYDQAHFNRAFKQIAGTAPMDYLVERAHVGIVQDI